MISGTTFGATLSGSVGKSGFLIPQSSSLSLTYKGEIQADVSACATGAFCVTIADADLFDGAPPTVLVKSSTNLPALLQQEALIRSIVADVSLRYGLTIDLAF